MWVCTSLENLFLIELITLLFRIEKECLKSFTSLSFISNSTLNNGMMFIHLFLIFLPQVSAHSEEEAMKKAVEKFKVAASGTVMEHIRRFNSGFTHVLNHVNSHVTIIKNS